MTESRLPSRSQRHGEVAVGHRAVGDDDAVVDGSTATAGASPSPGTRARKAWRPSGSCCTGPSPAGGAGRHRRPRPLATRGAVGERRARPARCVASASPIRASSSAATRAWAASASACTQAIDEPGMMSWNCCVSTSRHSASSSVPVALPAGGQPQLGLAQQPLAPPVADLRAQLAGQRAAVGLEVQLAAPHRHRCARRRSRPRRGRRTRRRCPCSTSRHPVEVGQPAQPLEHLAGRPAAAVAVAERHQRPVAPRVLGEPVAPSRPSRPA